MSGKKYRVFMATSAHRRYKKFDPALQERIKDESKKLSKNPHRYEELKETVQSGIRKQDSLNPQKYRYIKPFEDLTDGNTHIVAMKYAFSFFFSTFRSGSWLLGSEFFYFRQFKL